MKYENDNNYNQCFLHNFYLLKQNEEKVSISILPVTFTTHFQ
jgi:hypothetical protein